VTSFDDICNEDLVSVVTEGVIDVPNTSLLSALLDDSIVVRALFEFVLVSRPSVVISIFSVVISSVTDAIDENVDRSLALTIVVTI
jgi:hypothetical protein